MQSESPNNQQLEEIEPESQKPQKVQFQQKGLESLLQRHPIGEQYLLEKEGTAATDDTQSQEQDQQQKRASGTSKQLSKINSQMTRAALPMRNLS